MGALPRMTCRACGKDTATSLAREGGGNRVERSHTCPHGEACSGPGSKCVECTALRPALVPVTTRIGNLIESTMAWRAAENRGDGAAAIVALTRVRVAADALALARVAKGGG